MRRWDWLEILLVAILLALLGAAVWTGVAATP